MMQLPSLALQRLLQLASPLLPVGAYSYSQGLEWAIEDKIVHDADSALRWIGDALRFSMGRFEAPVLWRMLLAWRHNDANCVNDWNQRFCAARETAESRSETLQMGYSLTKLLEGLAHAAPEKLLQLQQIEPISFPTAFSFAAVAWQVPPGAALQGYLWSWAENQVSAAMKTVPLGQLAGQKMLQRLATDIPDIALHAMQLHDHELSNFCPALAIASSRHETQYSRLFRS